MDISVASRSANHATLIDLLRARAQERPENRAYTFLSDGEDHETYLSYEAIDCRARAISARLRALGAAGRPVLLLFPSGLEYVTAFFGCLYAGAIVVSVYPPRPNRTLDRFEAIAADSQAPLVLTQEDVQSRIEPMVAASPVLRDLRWLTLESIGDDLSEGWTQPDVTSDTLALLQYTSGSTAEPKGAMISHGNLLHNSRMIQLAFEHTEHSTVVGWLPLSHDMGLIGNMLQPLYVDSRFVFMSPESFLVRPFRWLKAIENYQASTSGAPNFAYDYCARRIKPEQRKTLDLSCWEVAYNGAEPIRSETLDLFTDVFGPYGFHREAFYPCYGLAESTLFVTGGTKASPCVVHVVDEEQERVSCGQTFLDQKVAIVNPESLEPCVPGDVGEIWVSGPSVAQGYWNKKQETDETFKCYDREGDGPFLRTGDLGFLLDNQLFVVGRLKDLIIVGGNNHYPVDIEKTVEASHPAVRPNCCAAFATDDADATEDGGAERLVVVAEIDRSFSRRRLGDAVERAIRTSVAEKHDLRVHEVALIRQASLPKTPSGKIQRHACRQKFLSGSLRLIED